MVRNRILVPIDGSEFSRQIFPYLRQFLPPELNEVVLFRVSYRPEGHTGYPARVATLESDVPMYDSSDDVEEANHPIFSSQEQASDEADLKLEMARDIRALQAEGYEVTSEVRFGHAGEAIVRYVSTHDVAMVAMTTHWRRGINRLIFGSVAQHVAHHIEVPIMMVHPTE